MNNTKWIVGLSIAGVMVLSGTAFALTSGSDAVKSIGQTFGYAQNFKTTAQGSQLGTPQPTILTPSSPNNNSNGVTTPGSNGYAGGNGMMGGQGVNGSGGGYGMMGGQGVNGYGGGYGMMGGGFDANSLGINLTNGQVTTSDQAIAISKAYAEKSNQGVVVDEIHEFSNGYEVELKEATTGDKAYEVMLYKNGGQIISEMGPNVMWNTKYGHMNWGNNGAVTVSEEQATKSAQEFAAKLGQSYSIDTPEIAPGYYEFMIQKDGKDYAELDVNGYTGQVWFENWHGPVINTIESEQVG